MWLNQSLIPRILKYNVLIWLLGVLIATGVLDLSSAQMNLIFGVKQGALPSDCPKSFLIAS